MLTQNKTEVMGSEKGNSSFQTREELYHADAGAVCMMKLALVSCNLPVRYLFRV